MSVLAQLKDYLDQHNIKYATITHSKAYTAQEIAQALHVPGREVAKSVVIKVDGQYALAVLPASHHVDIDKMSQAIGAKTIELATENDFENLFPNCELGAMPPFGNLFNLPVFVARDLRDDEEIVFNAGTHVDAIRMRYSDFERLVQPVVNDFSESTRAAKRGTGGVY